MTHRTGIGPVLAACAQRAIQRRTWVPLAAYYAITIAVPLANGSGSTDLPFLEHMAMVAILPLTLGGLFAMLGQAWRRCTTCRGVPSASPP